MNSSKQTYNESVQIDIEPEAICKIIDVPSDRVEIIYVELVVTNQTVRLDYALVLGADHVVQRNTKSRRHSDQESQLHFGYIQPADQAVRQNSGSILSPDQTEPFYHSLGHITAKAAAARRNGYLVQNLNDPGSISRFCSLIPNQPDHLFNSWLLFPKRMVSRLNGWSTTHYPAAMGSNKMVPTDRSNGLKPGKIYHIAVQFFPDVFREPEEPDKLFYSTLMFIAATVIIAAAGL